MTPLPARPVGDTAFVVDVPDLATVHRLRAAVHAAVAAGQVPAVVDVVPAYRSVLVVVDPARGGVEAVADAVRRLPLPDTAAAEGRTVELPVVYDGPDLAEVCARTGLPVHEVIARHAAPAYLVAFLGFVPGFPYLVGLDPALHVPRRATPGPGSPPVPWGSPVTRPEGLESFVCETGRGLTAIDVAPIARASDLRGRPVSAARR